MVDEEFMLFVGVLFLFLKMKINAIIIAASTITLPITIKAIIPPDNPLELLLFKIGIIGIELFSLILFPVIDLLSTKTLFVISLFNTTVSPKLLRS